MTTEITDAESDTTPLQTPEPPTEGHNKRPATNLKFFDKAFRDVWFYVAALCLVLNVTYTFRPQLSISSLAFDERNPASTLFVLTNIGAWTLYNVDTRCDIDVGTMHVTSISNLTSEGGNTIIDVLDRGEPATKDCAFGLRTNVNLRIAVSVSYNWFFGLLPGTVVRNFRTRPFAGHLLIIPDVKA
jgi:hypothetical protein